MRQIKHQMPKNLLPKFAGFLIEDGWSIHAHPEPNQALKAWKLNFKGEKKKWCIINHSTDIDADDCMITSFSTPMTEAFFRRHGICF